MRKPRRPTLAAVLGGDVSKSRSPAIHEAAFAALGIEGRYFAFSVDGRGFPRMVRTLRDDGFIYANVTIPHKRAAARLATRLGDRATRIAGAANTLVFSPRKIVAANTDGAGLL